MIGPADSWLDRLADRGRLILPLTTDKAFGDFGKTPNQMVSQGAMFRIARDGEQFHTKWISPVAIFPCTGNRDEASEHALAEALAKGRLTEITRLYRHTDVAEEDCWLRGNGWSLAYR